MSIELPELIENEETLDEVLTRPWPVLIEYVGTLNSPLLVLGAGGKMGPTLCALARRAVVAAGHGPEIMAVSRFSNELIREWLEAHGVRTLRCDLMDREALAQLPDSHNIIYMVGMKFGTSQDPAQTWATNTLLPSRVAERYPGARFVALSTGNVYPLVSIESGGAVESDPLTPHGEYANACVARERILEYWSRRNHTPIALIRLNYALDLRYGVLVDIARKVHAGQPIDVTQGYLNCIWQGDANEMIIRSLALASSPPTVLNLTGSSVLSVRDLALRFGELFGRPARVVGTEAKSALLSKTTRAQDILGAPPTPLDKVMQWTAHWIASGRRLLDKPTHYEVRDGRY